MSSASGQVWASQRLTSCAQAPAPRGRPVSRRRPHRAQVEQEHLTSRNILLERLRAVRETEAAETQAQASASGDLGAAQASDASTGTAVCHTAPHTPRRRSDGARLPPHVARWVQCPCFPRGKPVCIATACHLGNPVGDMMMPLSRICPSKTFHVCYSAMSVSSGTRTTSGMRDHRELQVDGQQAKGAEAWSAPPGKPMVTLTVHDGQGVDLTAEQIKKMTWHQHAKIWKVRPMRAHPRPSCGQQPRAKGLASRLAMANTAP